MTLAKRLTAVWIVTFALCGSSIAQTNRTPRGSPPSSGISGEAQIRERLNAGTIGLAGGLLEGAPIRFATEIARVVNDGGAVHVLPIVTRGPTENVNDLLYLRGLIRPSSTVTRWKSTSLRCRKFSSALLIY